MLGMIFFVTKMPPMGNSNIHNYKKEEIQNAARAE
jgi:hypothetical protein